MAILIEVKEIFVSTSVNQILLLLFLIRQNTTENEIFHFTE